MERPGPKTPAKRCIQDIQPEGHPPEIRKRSDQCAQMFKTCGCRGYGAGHDSETRNMFAICSHLATHPVKGLNLAPCLAWGQACAHHVHYSFLPC